MSPGNEIFEPGVRPNLRYDLPAGLVVFLVALPLCLGIALASDAPLMSGLVSGVVAGLIVAPLSGSQLAVSGPAAGLAVIVATGIADLGSFGAFLAAVVICGALQLIAGIVRAGALAAYFPVSVIKGMLAAIGIILILKQIPHALGRDKDYEGDMDFWVFDHGHSETNTFTELYAAVMSFSPGAVIISVTALGILLLWEQPFIKVRPWSRLLPGALVAVASGIGLNQLFTAVAPGLAVTSEAGHVVQLPIFRSLDDVTSQLVFADLTVLFSRPVLELGAVLAIIASIETLLSIEATDKLDPFRRVSNANRELVAQGLGNMLSGLLGGLPMTAVIVRSSTNIYAGGRTWISAFTHGVLLVAMVLAVPMALNLIPLASLAAVLLLVGWKLASPKLFKSMWQRGLDQFLPFVITVVVTVLSDLLIGVTVGVGVGIFMALITNNVSAVSMVSEEGHYLLRFTNNMTFLSKARLKGLLASIPNDCEVVIDGRGADFIDHDIYEVLDDFRASAVYRRLTVVERNLQSKAFPLGGRRTA